jgi:ferredoxin-NADP reductase
MTVTESDVVRPIARVEQHLLVREVRLLAPGVVSMLLEHDGDGLLPAWEPGAHVNLELPSGIVRSYSLCGDPSDRRHYRLAVLRELESTGGSREIHDTGLVGKRLRFTGPINNFKLVDATSYLFIAGGIGITPLLPMVHELTGRGVEYRMVYGGRSREQMSFVDELEGLCGERLRIQPEDLEGIPDIEAILSATPSGTAIYCCEPAGMLSAVEAVCKATGRASNLRMEWFAPPLVATPPPAPARPGAFEVELTRSNLTLQIPRGRSILSVVKSVVPDVIYGCGRGFCRDCETKVLEGVPDHRDFILSPEERASNKMMMICVSKSKTDRLVLDL